MPARLFVCTPTKLATWLDCPRRFRFGYVERPAPQRGPPWAHNSVGATVHNALRDWWSLPADRRTPSAAGRLVLSGWLRDGFRDDAQEASARDRAQEMVERYVTQLDPADEPLGVERTVATATTRLAVSGRVDRIDERNDELVIVDYKTGRHVLTTDDARGSPAMALYALAAARTLRRSCRRVELHHLPTGRVLGWEHTDDSLARHLSRAEATGMEAAAAVAAFAAGTPVDEAFPPRPSAACGWCDYLRVCDVGRAAAVPRKPWDGLPDPGEGSPGPPEGDLGWTGDAGGRGAS